MGRTCGLLTLSLRTVTCKGGLVGALLLRTLAGRTEQSSNDSLLSDRGAELGEVTRMQAGTVTPVYFNL